MILLLKIAGKIAEEKPFQIFPPVREKHQEIIPSSNMFPWIDSSADKPSLEALLQHRSSVVIDSIKNIIDEK